MASTLQVLNQQQRAFLESNYVIYDSVNQTYSQDFSPLEKCQVILPADIHVSRLLKEIQAQFLTTIIGNQCACLLAEGLSPGQSLKAREIPGRSYLPDTLDVRGADNRFNTTASQFIEIEGYVRSLLQLRGEDREHAGDVFGKIGKAFQAGLLQKESPYCFRIKDDTFLSIESLYKELLDKQMLRYKEMFSLDQKKLQLAQRNCPLRLAESNRGLFKEIEKACREFSRVVAIWGEMHFTRDKELISRLDRAGISYVILLHKEYIARRAAEEIRWNTTKNPIVEVTLLSSKGELRLRVPEIFYPFFFNRRD
ncbi:MAG TPA: hypothetical protein VMR37_08490 [Rhabdochlamydiaceae bacterium]|nr:hypothetical protein [Rhabdochlamydiaceae bacterium]